MSRTTVIWAWDDFFTIADDIREEEPETTEKDSISSAIDINNEYLDDIISTMKANDVENDIVCFASIGLWDGRRHGYKKINSLADCFMNIEDRGTWYVKDGEFKCDDCHHDGTNFYTYRMLKDMDFYDFEEMYFDSDDRNEFLNRYTVPMGDVVSKILYE